MTPLDLIQHPLVVGLASSAASLTIAHFVFSREILKETSQLKGMVTILLQRLALLDRVQEKLIGIDKDVDRQRYDLNNAWTKIRELSKGAANGIDAP